MKDFNFFEAKIKLDGNTGTSLGNVGIQIDTGNNYWLGLGIFGGLDADKPHIKCDTSEGYGKPFPAQYNTWYTLRIEINPETMIISCFVDGQRIDSFTPSKLDTFEEAHFSIGIMAWSQDGELVTGFVDNVQIGHIKQ